MSDNTYTCAMSHQTFEKEWTDEEALEELTRNFGLSTVEDCAIVCDDCYKKVVPV
jgi:hypothetical protein